MEMEESNFIREIFKNITNKAIYLTFIIIKYISFDSQRESLLKNIIFLEDIAAQPHINNHKSTAYKSYPNLIVFFHKLPFQSGNQLMLTPLLNSVILYVIPLLLTKILLIFGMSQRTSF